MPGYERSKIVGVTDKELDEFICGICLCLFHNPVVTLCCRQTYCKDCIREWVSLRKTCPNDRKTLTEKGLKPVPRVMINLLDNMKIKCNFESDGCSQVGTIEGLAQHLTVCDFRPNQLCKTCGLIKASVLTHNCIQSLICEKQEIDEKYVNLLDENSSLLLIGREKDEIIAALRRDLAHLSSEFRQNKTIHQRAIDGLKAENLKALRDSVRKKDETIASLQQELAHLRVNHQRTVERLKYENTKALRDFKMSYARAYEELRDYQANEVGKFKVANSKQERIISGLKWNFSDLEQEQILTQSHFEFQSRQIIKLNEELDFMKSNLGIAVKALV